MTRKPRPEKARQGNQSRPYTAGLTRWLWSAPLIFSAVKGWPQARSAYAHRPVAHRLCRKRHSGRIVTRFVRANFEGHTVIGDHTGDLRNIAERGGRGRQGGNGAATSDADRTVLPEVGGAAKRVFRRLPEVLCVSQPPSAVRRLMWLLHWTRKNRGGRTQSVNWRSLPATPSVDKPT